jgi:hypothetical protein
MFTNDETIPLTRFSDQERADALLKELIAVLDAIGRDDPRRMEKAVPLVRELRSLIEVVEVPWRVALADPSVLYG